MVWCAVLISCGLLPLCLCARTQWATFTYTVTDKTATSVAGIVWLVPPHHNLVYSGFSTSLEGWSITGNGMAQAALAAGGLTYEPYSRGLLNHYVIGTDAEINTDVPSNDDLMRWSFVAPSKFMGNFIIAYGGSLVFTLASAAGACARMRHTCCTCDACVCVCSCAFGVSVCVDGPGLCCSLPGLACVGRSCCHCRHDVLVVHALWLSRMVR